MTDIEYLERSIDLAKTSAVTGGGPFGAVIVTKNGNEYRGVNLVTQSHDPTAHAEVMAIRKATASERTFDLRGATLYSSCRPCPMCLTAALWARVSRIVYAATSEQAAEAGFDDSSFYEQVSGFVEDAEIEQIDLESSFDPFRAWKDNEARVDY